jgi:D-aminoacyl-tRNA deacylase
MVFVLKVLCCLFFISSKPTASMRLVVQRVKSASVTVQGKVVSQIDAGFCVLVGVHENDTLQDAEHCCKRLLACKLFANDTGGMWRHSVKQRNLELLLVSQFTLYGKLTKKNQPDYKHAMKNIPAEALYNTFLEMVREQYEAEKVKDGVFGEMMDVALVNDGPVTILIESEPVINGISSTPETLPPETQHTTA